MYNNFMFTWNFRLKLQNIIQKLSEHCDIKNPEELEIMMVSILIYIVEALILFQCQQFLVIIFYCIVLNCTFL